MRIARLLIAAVAAGVVAGWAGAPAALADGLGPGFTVPAEQLARAVQCDDGARSGRPTVLLIPSTGGTPREVWSWNYERALPAAGYGVCTVALPDRALGPFATSAEYAAYAALYAHRVSGRPIAIVGHSQGGIMAFWIAKFWPEVADAASTVIGLAAPLGGTGLSDGLCAGGRCSPISWQLRSNSHLMHAFRNAPLPSGPAYTSIASYQDEVVYPQPSASSLPGVHTVMVQDVCPGRFADHGLLVIDSAAYGLVLDTLAHHGPADAARIDHSLCSQLALPQVDWSGATGFQATLTAASVGLLNPANWTVAEPPLPAYAARYQ
ncbi:hypothetical protein K7711_32310 [Nocardia sp. CA2R105]|uniref:esterase/lipase family protein n=1 Tax=Nocardia coffeae TaxID=2873381 RepID=UPI001CA786FF|nr:hypothetical protein [Nocardia coffeae]MBY8861199.1 hypothetical protein [Nocardia coffeae]